MLIWCTTTLNIYHTIEKGEAKEDGVSNQHQESEVCPGTPGEEHTFVETLISVVKNVNMVSIQVFVL